jgi:hypothetical protein
MALAGFFFHYVRWRAASRLDSVPAADVAAHRRMNELLARGGA